MLKVLGWYVYFFACRLDHEPVRPCDQLPTQQHNSSPDTDSSDKSLLAYGKFRKFRKYSKKGVDMVYGIRVIGLSIVFFLLAWTHASSLLLLRIRHFGTFFRRFRSFPQAKVTENLTDPTETNWYDIDRIAATVLVPPATIQRLYDEGQLPPPDSEHPLAWRPLTIVLWISTITARKNERSRQFHTISQETHPAFPDIQKKSQTETELPPQDKNISSSPDIHTRMKSHGKKPLTSLSKSHVQKKQGKVLHFFPPLPPHTLEPEGEAENGKETLLASVIELFPEKEQASHSLPSAPSRQRKTPDTTDKT